MGADLVQGVEDGVLGNVAYCEELWYYTTIAKNNKRNERKERKMRVYTIRQAAEQADCPYREWRLRQMVKTGQVPHFKAGNRVYINFDLMLQEFAQMTATKGAAQDGR